jgi:hypothetical protein
LFFDPGQNLQQSLLGDNQGVTVTEKNPALAPAILSGKGDVRHNNFIRLDAKALASVSAAKSALVSGAADGYLQQDAVGLAGRPDDVSFVMHKLKSISLLKSPLRPPIFKGEDRGFFLKVR